MNSNTILNPIQFQLTVTRLCYELIENHDDFSNSALIGLQPRGIYLVKRLQKELHNILGDISIPSGALDITFYRDDFRRRNTPIAANKTEIDFIIEDKNVILVDDVFTTGATLESCAHVLKSSGVEKVYGLVVARAFK